MYCRNCGETIKEGATFCSKCGAQNKVTGTSFQTQNDSGQGSSAVLPDELRYWNWGAFFFNWLWAICNSVWIGLLALIPYVGFIMCFVLGAKGNEWAWQNKRWDNTEHFRRVQRGWAKAIGFLIIPLIIIVIIAIVLAVARAKKAAGPVIPPPLPGMEMPAPPMPPAPPAY